MRAFPVRSLLRLMCTLLLLAAGSASTARAQFVQASSFIIDGDLTKWGTAAAPAAGVSVFVDGFDEADANPGANHARVWMAWGTQQGGADVASPTNPLEFLYLRIDHKGTLTESVNFNLQLRLGGAQAGRVDHLLTMSVGYNSANRPLSGNVRVSLKEYSTSGGAAGYPLLGAFTTSSFDATVGDNLFSDPVSGAEGFSATAAAADGSWSTFEVKIPIAWLGGGTARLIEPDGSGVQSLFGALFSSGGSFGAVATVLDTFTDASGNNLILSSNTVTGATVMSPGTQLAFVIQPASAAVGATLAPFTVEVQNVSGARAAGSTPSITLTVASGPGSLGGTTSVNAVDGTATFSDITLSAAGTYTLTATSGGLLAPTSNAFTISAAAASAPVITGPSGTAGAAASSAAVAENTIAVHTFTANESVTWSLSGGTDEADFTINTSTGALAFGSAPDFENSADSDTNNTYVVELTATDGDGNASVQTLTVTVTDVDELAPVMTGPGAATGATSSTSIGENATAVHTFTASETVTWTLTGGTDQADFTINATTGALVFASAPDFENAADSDTNNSYVVAITATDAAGNASVQTLTVTVTDTDETAPVITGPGAATGATSSASIAENVTALHTFTASESVTWSLTGGTDQADFTINATTGALAFGSAPDFENAADSDTNNTYVVGITATDVAGNASTQTLTTTVTDVDEDAPAITGPSGDPGDAASAKSVAEGSAAVHAFTASESVTWSLTGGTDQADFTINASTGALVFASVPDFENAADSDTNNTYVVEITATDGDGNMSLQTLTVTITDVDEDAPTITGPGTAAGATSSISSAENATAVHTFAASELVTWTLTGGADQADFTINASTGALVFASVPDFENATDSDTNNTYVVAITATDAAGNASTQTLTITITDTDEIAPTFNGPESAPADDASGVALGADLVLDFSEAVIAGSGAIELRATSGNTLVESFDVVADAGTGPAQVSITADKVTLNPVADLAPATAYHITIAATALVDLSGNGFGGISSATDYNIETVAGTRAAHVTLTGPTEVIAGEISTAVTLTVRDAGGDPATVLEATSFALSSSSSGEHAFFSDAAGAHPVSQVTVPAGQSTSTVYYRDVRAASPALTVNWLNGGGTDLGEASYGLLVVEPAAPFTAILTGPSGVTVGEVAGPFHVTVVDEFGNPAPVGTNTLYTLVSALGAFYADAAGTTPISDLTVLSGQPTAAFYFRPEAPGQLSVVATWTSGEDVGAASLTQDLAVTAEVVMSAPDTLAAGAISRRITLTTHDASGEPVAVTAATVFDLRSSSTGVVAFYADSAATTPITQLALPAGASMVSYFYRDTQAGVPTLSATWVSGGADLGTTEVQLRVTPGLPSREAATISANPDTIAANGTSTATIVLQLKDIYGNNWVAAGEAVTLSTTHGALSAVTDRGDGTFTAVLTSTEYSDVAVLFGTLNGRAIVDRDTVVFTGGSEPPPATLPPAPSPPQASGAHSTITASPEALPANGVSTSEITVRLRDPAGRDLTSGGDSVVILTTLGTLGPVTDRGDGTYTATLTSPLSAGVAVLSGTVGGVAIGDSATVRFGAARLVFDLLPDSVFVDSILPATVRVVDGAGQTVTSFTGEITVGAVVNDTALTFGGTSTITVEQGAATFSDLHFPVAARGVVLVAHHDGGILPPAASDSFDVVLPPVDLTLEMQASSASPVAGEELTYTVVLTNLTSARALDVEVRTPLPQRVEYLGATPEAGSYDPELHLWRIASIEGNTTIRLVIRVRVIELNRQ